jgi:arginyl-tRNA synthetase
MTQPQPQPQQPAFSASELRQNQRHRKGGAGYHQRKAGQIAEVKQTNQPTEALEAEIKSLQAECVDEQARQYFKRMCDGESEALQLWKKFGDLSIVKYEETFARLNIHFDEYWGESQVQDASMERAKKILKEKGVTEESQSASIVDLTKYSKALGKAIV